MRTRRPVVALVSLLAALGVLAACGGADDGLTAGVASVGDDRPTADRDPDRDADESDDAGGPDESDGGESREPADDVGPFCAAIDDFDYLGAIEAPSPEELRDAYTDYDERADEIAAVAPAEISADVEVALGSGRQIRDLIEEHDYEIIDAATDPAFVEILSPEVVDASLRLDAYVTENC